MIIIYKKNLFFMFLIFFIILIFILLNIKTKTIFTSSTPVSNHVIILDAGHGFPDGGATNNLGIIESDLNLKVVLKLQKYLETSGTTVILTRSDENGIYDLDATSIRDQKVSDMKNRVDIGNNSNAEIFISIHMNKIQESKYKGWQTFYQKNNNVSKEIAQKIQTNLNTYIDLNNKREIKIIPDIYLSKNIEIPLVLVECGFLSNPEESNLLNSDLYQEKLAWCIYSGIIDYYN